jgi:membrane fusion protein, multidrug efflux system
MALGRVLRMIGTPTREGLMKRIALVVLVGLLTACGKQDMAKDGAQAAVLANTASQPLLLSPEDILTVRSNALASCPSITGSVQPERRADLRAEISAVVLQVLKENGDPVRRGDLLVRLDDTAIRDSLNSTEASARAAAQAYQQAQRQFERLNKLRASGMVSAEAVEDAEVRRNNAQSDLEAAKTRAVVARQQLQRTESRAPFDGIVSDRKVSAGDTAQVGKELVKVIDPHSMRFEGMVSADSIGMVKAGQAVVFRVHGFADQAFNGRITRVNPAANVTTRQVEVLVEFADAAQQPRLAGLYAEGWVETNITAGHSLPGSTVVKDGDRSFAWRLENNALQKVLLVLGERDPRSGEFAVMSGLQEGDRVLRYPTSTLHDGQAFALAAHAPTPDTAPDVTPAAKN